MTSPVNLYPEFDGAEIQETIEPLSVFDAAVRTVLTTASEPAPADCPAFVVNWSRMPETYPFQRVIRQLALPAAVQALPADHADMFADADDITVQVLTRAESRIRDTATRALVAAVNQASVDGVLSGDTPQDRYEHFVRAVWPTYLAQFPVLTSAVTHVVRNTRAAARELFERLAQDRDALQRRFAVARDDRLVSIGDADGDAHAHGRCVSILTFASGARLVYKPRDISCEAAFETITAEVNRMAGTALPAASALARGGYGYVAYVQAEDVTDQGAPFMRACGELAAVFYLLDARDMHFENILATRRGPVPVDLETLLHPARVHTGPKPEADGNAYDAIGRSVYGIGILPLVLPGKDENSGHVDLGFLGGDNQGVSPFKSMVFDHPFTDRMRMRLQAQPAEQRSTVVREGSEEEIHRLAQEMADGFMTVCQAVRREASSWTTLLKTTAPALRIRYIHNPTSLYAQSLRMTSSAAAMAGTDLSVGLLKRIAIPSKLSDPALVGSEMVQMAERDIPYFTAEATGTAVYDCDGNDTGARLAEPPLARALAKATALDDRVIDQQLSMLYAAFCARFPDNHLSGHKTWDVHPVGSETAPLEELARVLADDLVASNLPDKFAHLPSTWIGPLASAQATRPWPSGVLGYDLYTGRTGPALALAAAGLHFDEPRYLAVARQIFSTSAAILSDGVYEQRSVRQNGPGAYTGMAGLLLSLSVAGRMLDEPGWIKAAQEAVPLVADQCGPADSPDVITGIAGTAAMIATVGGSYATGALTGLCAHLDQHINDPRGSWWEQSGFAHGVAGVLHTLAVLRPHTGDRVDPAIGLLLDRLATFYDPREENWFTNTSTRDRFSTGWCHGAAGIALGLWQVAQTTGEPRAGEWLDTALANTVRYGFGRNLTWCHGDLGNHDILSHIAARRGDPALLDEIADSEARWLHPSVISQKLADRTSRYAHTNSVMLGTSGVLLHLVRRLAPGLRISPICHGVV
ncbi:type 2 lanthipeptide synthetase LanM family protein [Streptomyces sp. NBC_01431]|uniref:type 2 lanthipeptide synthetase LanM family protein n=1 Tax=Streptomyces sp. NBC_01431 TaxID=2903863 RepID=UPI002E2F903B|nr:type 2 lanthipeptide synthetase LanM family protein [Streptomyces sp. NBC_01431]